MANQSRHNLSRASTIFQGSSSYANYQGGKAGIETSLTYFWRPGGIQPLTFTGSISQGATTATLSSNFVPPSGFYLVTLSSGQQVTGFFTQGSTAVTFYPSAFPANAGIVAPAGLPAAQNATGAVINNVPLLPGTATQIAASQSISAAGSAVLNGTYLNNVPGSSTQTIAGTTYTGCIVPDAPRNVVAAWTTSSTVKVSGFDCYNQPMTEQQTGTSFTGKKAFAIITGITSSAAVTGFTAGFGNVFGLPFQCASGRWFGGLVADAQDAGVFTPRDDTMPATSTSGDTRGTYAPAATLNGAKWMCSEFKVSDTTTQIGSFGVTPA